MKKYLSLVASILISLPMAQAAEKSKSADPDYLECTNGTIESVGDGLFQVDVKEDGIEIKPYEGSLTVDASDFVNSLKTYAIVDKPLTYSDEGIEEEKIVNAMLILDDDKKTLRVAISFDYGPFRTYDLKCELKTP